MVASMDHDTITSCMSRKHSSFELRGNKKIQQTEPAEALTYLLCRGSIDDPYASYF